MLEEEAEEGQGEGDNDEDKEQKSKKQLKKEKRLSIAVLKSLVKRPFCRINWICFWKSASMKIFFFIIKSWNLNLNFRLSHK